MPTDYTKIHIFRMVHFDNLEYVLQNGMAVRTHKLADSNYINIGDSNLIQQRQEYPVRISPGGNLGDYVPFYFGGHSPMLLNIKTGYRGIEKRNQADIVFVVCTVGRVVDHHLLWCFTDGHAKENITQFYNQISDLAHVDWKTVKLQYWHNCDEDWDRQRKKQAEFLVRDYVPVTCIVGIIVFSQPRKEQTEEIMRKLNLDIKVIVDDKHNYFYL